MMPVKTLWSTLWSMLTITCAAAGCAHAPSPLVPSLEGSIGAPAHGVLTRGVELARDTPGVRWLRNDDRHWAVPRLTEAIARAASIVAQERPGSPPLYVGDLSKQSGGVLLPHFSHRTGLDADLLLYATTLDGAPVESPGFIHFGADGLAFDAPRGRYLRFDVEREWILVKALIEDPNARVQWIFANHVLEAMLIEWARARGEPIDTIYRAQAVLLEPNPGGEHDDHVHVRTTCSTLDIAHGCLPSGPQREWLADSPKAASEAESTETLVLDILRPIEPPASVSMAP